MISDRCWAFPELDRLADHLDADTVATPAKVDATLALLAASRPDPERAVMAGSAAAEQLLGDHEVVVAGLLARADAEGVDDADAADALGLAAQVLVGAAWQVRGAKRAQYVGEEAWPVFHRMLAEADEVGRTALLRRPGDPLAAFSRLGTGLGLGLPAEEWWPRFDVARRARPTLFPAHWVMLQASCSKWYGSNDSAIDFARTTAEQAPPGDPVTAMLPLAHLELWAEERWSRGDPMEPGWRQEQITRDLPLVEHCSRQFLAADAEAAAAGARHPRAPEAHQFFGWLLWQQNHAAAGAHLAAAEGRMAKTPWASYYQDGGQQAFRIAMAKTGVPAF